MIVIKEFWGNVLKFGLDELGLTAELAQRNVMKANQNFSETHYYKLK